MKRINVVGTSGSGKSTFGRQLSQQICAPYIEMDALFWQPNWEETPDAEFFVRVEQALNGDAWVLDGNYNRTVPVKWQRVDTVIWLDYSFTRTTCQAVKRAVSRSLSGRELWPGTGNRESLRKSFFSRDSIVWWTLKTYYKNRQRYLTMMQDADFSHIRFIHLRDPRQAAQLLKSSDVR
ncbi:adenylate kinase [Vibrio fluvialis]|nr:adenylate kinase [Vibrio fluvialis]